MGVLGFEPKASPLQVGRSTNWNYTAINIFLSWPDGNRTHDHLYIRQAPYHLATGHYVHFLIRCGWDLNPYLTIKYTVWMGFEPISYH